MDIFLQRGVTTVRDTTLIPGTFEWPQGGTTVERATTEEEEETPTMHEEAPAPSDSPSETATSNNVEHQSEHQLEGSSPSCAPSVIIDKAIIKQLVEAQWCPSCRATGSIVIDGEKEQGHYYCVQYHCRSCEFASKLANSRSIAGSRRKEINARVQHSCVLSGIQHSQYEEVCEHGSSIVVEAHLARTHKCAI